MKKKDIQFIKTTNRFEERRKRNNHIVEKNQNEKGEGVGGNRSNKRNKQPNQNKKQKVFKKQCFFTPRTVIKIFKKFSFSFSLFFFNLNNNKITKFPVISQKTPLAIQAL